MSLMSLALAGRFFNDSAISAYPYVAAVVKSLSCARPFATPWTEAHQAPLSMGFSKQGYWSGLLFLSLEDLPDPGIEPVSLMSLALAGRFFII